MITPYGNLHSFHVLSKPYNHLFQPVLRQRTALEIAVGIEVRRQPLGLAEADGRLPTLRQPLHRILVIPQVKLCSHQYKRNTLGCIEGTAEYASFERRQAESERDGLIIVGST